MIAKLNRTVPYFFVLSTLWYETYQRTVPYFGVPWYGTGKGSRRRTRPCRNVPDTVDCTPLTGGQYVSVRSGTPASWNQHGRRLRGLMEER